MTTTARRLLAGLILAAALIGAACQPGLPAPAAPNGTAAGAPLVIGDSITWQAMMSGGFVGTGYRDHTMMGWQMSTPQVQQRLAEERAAGTLDELVIALGTNDSNPVYNGGWTASDRNLWASTILNLHPDTRLVIVLPWVCNSPATGPSFIAAVDKARADITAIASSRPNTTVVDWQPYAVGNLSADCIHLLGVDPSAALPAAPEATQARMRAIADGLAAVR